MKKLLGSVLGVCGLLGVTMAQATGYPHSMGYVTDNRHSTQGTIGFSNDGGSSSTASGDKTTTHAFSGADTDITANVRGNFTQGSRVNVYGGHDADSKSVRNGDSHSETSGSSWGRTSFGFGESDKAAAGRFDW